MLKELAAVMDGDSVSGFVVYDGQLTKAISAKEAEREAAAGNIDVLGFADGQFVPILQGGIAEEIRKKGARYWNRTMERTGRMTFKDFIENDCLFEKAHVELAMARKDICLACVCLAYEMLSYMTLALAFWCPDPRDADTLRDALDSYAAKVRSMNRCRDYDGFLMVSLPLMDTRTGFRLLEFQETAGMDFIYSLGTLRNMKERAAYVREGAGPLARCCMDMTAPTDAGLRDLRCMLDESNRRAMMRMSERGQDRG